MGILDNWLPVLHAARASHPEWRIVALIPDREILAQLDPEDTAHILADEVIDATIAPLLGGDWIQVEGFLRARSAAAPRSVLRRLPTRAQRQQSIDLSALDSMSNSLLFDVHLYEKPDLEKILASFRLTPHFSYNHGLILEQEGERSVELPAKQSSLTVFAFSPEEIRPYSANFGIDEDHIVVAGVTRHDRQWVENVIERSRSIHSIPFSDCVFLISRPAGSAYLPRDHKVQALRDLYQVAWVENGLPLLIRAHPKESADGTLQESLPRSEENYSWALTKAHPFHASVQSSVAVAFFSGVVVDTVALQVPTIEFLSLGELRAPASGWSQPGGARGFFSPYRRDGLVLGVEDIETLREAFLQITKSRAELISTQSRALSQTFESESALASDMLQHIAHRPWLKGSS